MNLQDKSQKINELLYDLTAEYVTACLLDERKSNEDIIAVYESSFKRKWSTDIDCAQIESFENGKEALGIHLNRDGIYDSLPEALFHDFSDNPNAAGKDMSMESMHLRSEEKHVRAFFRPFENEIFFQRTQIAFTENEKFKILNSTLLNELIPGFWKIDRRIPSKYVLRLIQFLPFVHRIAGNYELTARCLKNILDEKVNINVVTNENIKQGSSEKSDEIETGRLGKCRLGTNFIPGSNVSGYFGKVVFQIGPLENTHLENFFENGPTFHLLQCFYGYFIPIELDWETKLVIHNPKRGFCLSSEDKQTHVFLGYSTKL